MMNRLILIGIVLVTIFIIAGCTQHLGNFTALSTGTFRPENLDEKHKVASDVTGDTKSPIICGIPIAGYPKVDQAVAEALAKSKGDFMQNARLYNYYWTVIVYGEIGYTVTGDVYKSGR